MIESPADCKVVVRHMDIMSQRTSPACSAKDLRG